MQINTVLTGITTTGTPHLGNYVGAIKPAIKASRDAGVQSYYFLADYHALIKSSEPARIRQSTLEIAATWLALGLDTETAIFYRQSDIPEITELTWMLTCVTAKGLMNRAHAYKAAVQENLDAGEDADFAVTLGLFSYPVLMAADILLFKARQVPVGRDQVQHLEMARDIAQRFNHLFGEHFVLPEAVVDEHVAVLPGQDGRKMSKSYNNTIPLWLPQKQLRKAIMKIVTNSLEPGQPKDPADSALYSIYAAFASVAQRAEMQQAFAAGIGWGDAKQQAFELIDAELAQARDRYQNLISRPEQIEEILQSGASRAREFASPFMADLRAAVGIQRLA
jgi:tryptophanyl-tRNA synthetase